MGDPTIRPANSVLLIRLMTSDTDLVAPDPLTDAVPFEVDSVSRNSPFTLEQSSEATGSLVTGAPLVIGQPATVSFRSRIKGAGAGVTYTSMIKPPLHAALAACGRRPQFTAAIATALATAGSATTATLAAGFPATAAALVGMPLSITAGIGVGATPLVTGYTSGRVATLSDNFTTPLDNTSSLALPANWSYAGTSPADATARATDQPMAIVYLYRDGQLWRWTHCRGIVGLDGRTARPGYAAFNFNGIFAGQVDAAVPTTAVIANHLAPTLVQGSAVSNAVLLNRKPLAISTWSLEPGSQAFNSEDPNTNNGFGQGELAERTQMLKFDPLATLIANRNTIADIGAGVVQTGVIRHGTVAGNRWSLTLPRAQSVGEEDGTRERLLSEQLTLQVLNSGRDAVTRDTDSVLTFY